MTEAVAAPLPKPLPNRRRVVAKKKSSPRKTADKKAAGKKAVSKKAAKKPARKPAAKKAASGTKKSAAKPKKKSAAARKKTAKPKPAKKRKKLGRPRLPADAPLDHVFQRDFEARQICEFLGVSTLKELERFGPDEIVQRLTSPVIQTVGRMRKVLAIANRSLAGDEEFAIDFRERYAPK